MSTDAAYVKAAVWSDGKANGHTESLAQCAWGNDLLSVHPVGDVSIALSFSTRSAMQTLCKL